MDYEICDIPAFQLIGKLYIVLTGQDSYKLITEFWTEFMKQFEAAFSAKETALPEEKQFGRTALASLACGWIILKERICTM